MNGEDMIKKAYEAILHHDFEQAIGWFEQAILLEPDHPGYHYKLSISYARSDRINQALQHARQAVELDSSHPEYHQHLQHVKARALVADAEELLSQSAEHATEAIRLLNEAIDADPLCSKAYLWKGAVYAAMQQYEMARQQYEEAVRMDPSSKKALEMIKHIQRELEKESNE
ncbi:tetratricopeptide repeat protein [Marinicrinis sediminis]|uniref:Tetratricopeptide repeat protein n=1 Tax=Marinicrinis sediminis TaxID=1652465 RepID=A0ABW5REC3_9BACL